MRNLKSALSNYLEWLDRFPVTHFWIRLADPVANLLLMWGMHPLDEWKLRYRHSIDGGGLSPTELASDFVSLARSARPDWTYKAARIAHSLFAVVWCLPVILMPPALAVVGWLGSAWLVFRLLGVV